MKVTASGRMHRRMFSVDVVMCCTSDVPSPLASGTDMGKSRVESCSSCLNMTPYVTTKRITTCMLLSANDFIIVVLITQCRSTFASLRSADLCCLHLPLCLSTPPQLSAQQIEQHLVPDINNRAAEMAAVQYPRILAASKTTMMSVIASLRRMQNVYLSVSECYVDTVKPKHENSRHRR